MSNNKLSIMKSLSLLTHIGIVMIIPIFGGVYIGNLIDKKLNTNHIFMFVFIIVGVVAGFMNVYKAIMKETERDKEMKKR